MRIDTNAGDVPVNRGQLDAALRNLPSYMPKRCGYLFQLRFYESNEHGLAAATMFATWTMANGDFLGMSGNDVFIEVSANCRQEYSDFMDEVYEAVKRDGHASPKMPTQLRKLIDKGLDVKSLLEKHPVPSRFAAP